MIFIIKTRIPLSMSPARLLSYSSCALAGLFGWIVLCATGLQLYAGHGVSAANLRVLQSDLANTTNSVSVSVEQSINDFRLRDGSNRGDYMVQIGDTASDDVATGVLISCVARNGQDNGEESYPGTNFCTAAIHSSIGEGSYFIPVFNTPDGAEYNSDVAAGFFDYTRWLGGYARNSGDTTGGVNDLLTASAGIALGTHFVEKGSGAFTVDLRSFGIDSRTDGVLLVCGGRNEDNYALSQANDSDGTWNVWVKDNGADKDAFEQDPVAFVFVPKTNTSVICGKFQGNGAILIHSGGRAPFSVTNLATGVWRLQIDGQTPQSGVLLVSPEGGTSVSQDNIVTFEAAGDGWLIQSRDLPQSPPGLQTPAGPVASFVFIPVAGASLVAPLANAVVTNSTSLEVALFDSVPGDVTVTYYGREAPSPYPGPDFTIVVLPDTQYYTAEANGGVKGMFIAQTEWAVTNRLSRNVAYVAHLGDISNNGDTSHTQWRNATNAMYRLEDEGRTKIARGIPYGLAVGNHDQYPNGDPAGTTTYYNRYFGISRFEGRPYYGGHYGTNNDNHFDLFSAGGLDFIVLYFEYFNGGDANALAWAQQVLSTNLNRRIIAVTHYMGAARTPSTHSPQGAAIYNALKSYPNLFLLLGGHVSGEGSRVDSYNGVTTYTFIQDYQSRINGGNGWMRLFEFSPSNNVVTVQTHNPWTGEYETDFDSETYFSYDMQLSGGAGSPGTPYAPIATNMGVAPGTLSAALWSGLQAGKTYDWYVVVTDSAGNTSTSGPWAFSTPPNHAPVASSKLFNIPGDQVSVIQLIASDPDGDPIIYRTNSLPQRGIITAFDTNTGSIAYAPVRGYRGSDPFSFSVTDGRKNSGTNLVNLMIQNPPDADYDGLPDAWEAAFGAEDPAVDSDADGQNNLDEYRAGTNPTNSASAFRIISTAKSVDRYDMHWSSVGGTRYRVQVMNADPGGGLSGTFADVVRSLDNELEKSLYGTASTQGFSEVFSPGATNGRYYRVKIVQ